MSKIGKIFKFAADPLGLFKKKKKVFILPPKAQTDAEVKKQGSEAEVAQRRTETQNRLRSGAVTTTTAARIKPEEEEEELIQRAGSRRAKLLGS